MIVVNSRFLTQRITGVQRFSIELSLQIKKKLGSRVLFVSPPNILHNDLAEILEVKVIGTRTGFGCKSSYNSQEMEIFCCFKMLLTRNV